MERDVRSFDAVLRDVLARYPSARGGEPFGTSSTFWPLVGELKAALEGVPCLAQSKRTKVKVSFGQGGWAEVPNFAIMDTRETERPSAGIYMVYLMPADAGGLILSLNQGSADLILEARGRVYDVLAARAERVRAALQLQPLSDAGFTAAVPDLRSAGQYPRAYSAGSIVAKTYPAKEIPGAEVLAADLAVLHRAYTSVVPSSRLRLHELSRGGPAARLVGR